MRKPVLCVGLASLCLAGCTATRIDLPDDPVQMTVIQRCSKPIPGSDGTIKIHIGDVTGGQVLLSVRKMNGKAIVDTVSVEAGDTVPFNLGDNQYYLTVIELRNFLVGDDFGVFEVSGTAPPTSAGP